VRVLVVEPDRLLGGVYRQALGAAGHEVTLTTGAQEAIVLADTATPDVVVLELQLSGHGGLEFLYEFRSYPEWQAVPIILHTFVPERMLDIPAGLSVGPYLYKPSSRLSRLIRAVNEAG